MIPMFMTERTSIDKAAAGRFIKHAIAQSTHGRPPGDSAEATSSDVRVPARVTSKMVARAEYEKELNELGSEEEEELKMFDEPPEEAQREGDSEEEENMEEVKLSKGKGKQKAVDADEDDSQGGVKRKRPRMDPFAGKSMTSFRCFWVSYAKSIGYGDNQDTSANKPKKARTPTRASAQNADMTGISQASTIATSMDDAKSAGKAKKAAKAARKAKKADR